MGANTASVVSADSVIVSPKKEPVSFKFRWDPDLLADIRKIAESADRSMNEAGEMLMRWAVARAKAELEIEDAERDESPLKRKR